MVTQETLELAMKKAVEVGLIPKTAPAEIYLKKWEGMRAVLEAVEQGVQSDGCTCGAKIEEGELHYIWCEKIRPRSRRR